jgi:hypothetical protein
MIPLSVPSIISSDSNGDSDWSSVILLLPFDSDLQDDSSASRTVSETGTVAIETTTVKFGDGSADFTASGNYLSVPTVLGDFSGDFTIELWAYCPSFPAYNTLFSRRASAVYAPFELVTNGTGLVQMMLANSTNDGWEEASADFGLSLTSSTWHHVAFVCNSNTLDLYVDGTKGTTSYSSVTIANTTDPLYLGKGGDGEYVGYMDDVRVTKGVARYTSSFTAPTAPFPTS